MQEKGKITAVVVTYNRIELLKECITSLRNQTRKLDEIIVVNNDSNDGTKEWLKDQKDLTVINQANLGGAGGFHTGIKTAYEKGYDWIWCMDDDCLPRNNALEKLFENDFDREVVLNSVVVNKTQPEKLNFGLEDYKLNKYYDYVNEISGNKIINGANFFNGTLLPKSVISKIGLPNSNFFIYGDEYEYYLRIKSQDILINTITSSIVFHPEQKHIYIGKGKLFYRYNYINKLRVKYYPGNSLAVCLLYKEYPLKRLFKTYLLDIYGLIFMEKQIVFAFQYLSNIPRGLTLLNMVRKKHD